MPLELQTNISLETRPTDPKHLVNMAWVEEFVAGLTKAPVAVVSISDEDGSYDPNPGQLTLTYTAMGETIIDGHTLALNDRVLLTGQTDETQNGIYYVFVAGDPSTHTVLARASDFNSDDKIQTGVTIPVTDGDTHADTTWKLITTGTITLDTTNLEFELVPPSTTARKFADTITGDDLEKDFVVNHKLGTTDVEVQIFNASSKGWVLTDVAVTDANNVTIGFDKAPSPSQVYRVVVIG